jgi:formylmethanofuran dehydrogenase subunit C
MGLFEKLLALKAMAPYLEKKGEDFIEEKGWRDIILSIKEFKDPEVIRNVIKEITISSEKDKIIRGFMATIGAQFSDGEFECQAVDYAGCFMEKGILKLQNDSKDFFPDYIGMGMAASDSQCKIIINGNVGNYLGYRSIRLFIELRGDARDGVAMGVGEGHISIVGNVVGGIGGESNNIKIEVDGSVGRINKDNTESRFLISENIHWDIGENLRQCFVKVNGDVGTNYKETGKQMSIAPKLLQGSVLLIGGDVYGNLGKGLAIGKIFVWGKVYGTVEMEDKDGGFVYLNKKKIPLAKRLLGGIGKGIGLKYVNLKESGYLFAENEEDLKELIDK